jgi:hypothetical protein
MLVLWCRRGFLRGRVSERVSAQPPPALATKTRGVHGSSETPVDRRLAPAAFRERGQVRELVVGSPTPTSPGQMRRCGGDPRTPILPG